MNDAWKNNPELKNMDKDKLDTLQKMAEQGAGKNPSELLTFLLEASAQNRKSGLNFTQPEISVILDVLKEGKTPAEKARIDRITALMKMIK